MSALLASRKGDIRLGWYREKLEWTKREVVNQELMGEEVEGSGVTGGRGAEEHLVPGQQRRVEGNTRTLALQGCGLVWCQPAP